MRKGLVALLAIPLLLSGCNNATPATTIVSERLTGEIAAFSLTGPENGFVTNTGFTFTWEVASNAEQYSIEISETENFYNDKLNSTVYVKENNISQNKYDLTYSLPKKDVLYYWRVTALNKDHTKLSNEVGTFFYEAQNVGEIPIEIEDAQDWAVHKDGSAAEVAIDRNNFFDNGNKNSLVISFLKEDTSVGPVSRIGWIVVTKSEDRELYGTDAFYMNFYYSGHDSSVLIRVLDGDGEYWHQKVKISNNAKQTVILKYSDFELRTSGTNIFNRKFDWEHIHYFEIVFEETFGDGVCMLSDIRAVSVANYEHMYMDKMNFKRDDIDEWTYETYEFGKSVSNDGNELTLSYSGTETAELKKFPGYGFQNINVYKFFTKGDALRMKVKYSGTNSGAIFYFRVTEEDKDRWQFKIPFSELAQDEFKEFIIPMDALQRMTYMNGDGAKQFYFIYRFNVGLSENYATGSISIKDLELVKLDDILESRTKVVTPSGTIEDFDDYNLYTEAYYYWSQSSHNKDEAIKLDTTQKVGGRRNINCAEFDYKADMKPAIYQMKLDSSACVGKNAFRIWLNDASKKPAAKDAPDVQYLDPEKVAADLIIQLELDTKEQYRYEIKCVKKEWHAYTIAFSDENFELANKASLAGDPKPLTSEHVVSIALAFQYWYYDENNNPCPTYAIANPVYMDELSFVEADETVITKLNAKIEPDTDETVTIDTFENYLTDADVADYWYDSSNKDYSNMELSDEVSYLGGEKSLKLDYSDKVSYARETQFDSTVKSRGVSFDIKADGDATIEVYIYLRSGTKLYKLKYQESEYSKIPIVPATYGSSSEWYHYEIGFNFFKDVDGSTKTVTNNTAKDIEAIEFVIYHTTVKTEEEKASAIYLDNFRLLRTIAITDRTIEVIEEPEV